MAIQESHIAYRGYFGTDLKTGPRYALFLIGDARIIAVSSDRHFLHRCNIPFFAFHIPGHKKRLKPRSQCASIPIMSVSLERLRLSPKEYVLIRNSIGFRYHVDKLAWRCMDLLHQRRQNVTSIQQNPLIFKYNIHSIELL